MIADLPRAAAGAEGGTVDSAVITPRPNRTCLMEACGVLPGRDLPARAEVVHESGRTRVTRHFVPGRTVIRKEPLGPDAERRVRHEVAVLERLRGVPGVVQLAEAPGCPGSVVLEDAGGTSLAGQCCNVAVVIDWTKYLHHVLELNPTQKYARVQPGTICDTLRNAKIKSPGGSLCAPAGAAGMPRTR